MRTTKERIMLLIEHIIGKEKADQLFNDEKIVLLNGKLFELDGSEYKVAMTFAFGNSYVDDNFYNESHSFRNCFNKKIDNIDNDENKVLQVDILSSKLQKDDVFKARSHYYDENKSIIDILHKAFPEKYNVILRYVYEEFDGKVSQFTKIRLNNHYSWPDAEFKSKSDKFTNDDLFFRTVRDFFATYYATYISFERIEENLSSIVDTLPAIILEEEYQNWKSNL